MFAFKSESPSNFYNSFYTYKQIASYDILVNNNFPNITKGIGFTTTRRINLLDVNNNANWSCSFSAENNQGCLLQCHTQTLQRIPHLYGFGIIL